MHWWATAIRGGTRRPTARSHGAFPPIPSSAHRHGATRLDSGPWSRVYDGRTFNEEALMSASSISPSLTISRLAERAGVGIDTVRYYERAGLLPAPPRRASGYRDYPADSVQRLRFIRRAKDLGFTLTEIGELLELSGPHGDAGKRGRRAGIGREHSDLRAQMRLQ